jgi:glutaredoxin 1
MQVEIYGAEWCTFCKNAVQLCESRDITYKYIDIDESANLRALEERIGSKVRSVPQIFLNGEFIQGGYSGLQQTLARTAQV